MANIIPNSFRGALFEANHNFKASGGNTFKISLYTSPSSNAKLFLITDSWVTLFPKILILSTRNFFVSSRTNFKFNLSSFKFSIISTFTVSYWHLEQLNQFPLKFCQ